MPPTRWGSNSLRRRGPRKPIAQRRRYRVRKLGMLAAVAHGFKNWQPPCEFDWNCVLDGVNAFTHLRHGRSSEGTCTQALILQIEIYRSCFSRDGEYGFTVTNNLVTRVTFQ